VTSSTVIVIEEFDADVFRQLVEYVHTGCVTLQPRTLLGMYTSEYNNCSISSIHQWRIQDF
jgi:hypothetical protein